MVGPLIELRSAGMMEGRQLSKNFSGESPWRIVRDNGLWDQDVTPGTTLRVRPEAPKPTFLTYRVSSGDTLGRIASRHGTSVRAIQSANGLGRNTIIRIGQRLRVPAAAN